MRGPLLVMLGVAMFSLEIILVIVMLPLGLVLIGCAIAAFIAGLRSGGTITCPLCRSKIPAGATVCRQYGGTFKAKQG